MKTIGLIGGMSWSSTIEYYRILNVGVARKLGRSHSAKVILYSVDFQEIVEMQQRGAWDEAGERLASAARALEGAGAEIVLICAVTMHKVADAVQRAVRIPLLHIGDATAKVILNEGFNKVGLLGTRYTMEDPFLVDRLGSHGIVAITPDAEERETIHRVIYEELTKGMINEESRDQFRRIMERLCEQGAQGIILGCTEIPLLVKREDSELPLWDTTLIHASAALAYDA